MTDRRTGSVGVNVDLDRRPGITLNRQTGSVGVMADLMPVYHSSTQTGWLGVLVDLRVLLVTGIGWSGSAFVASGGTPVLWGASAFQTAGGYPAVQWETDHFEAES